MPEQHPSFDRLTDAVLQFQDVVGSPVVQPELESTPYGDPDADSYLFGQAGNDGRFTSEQFPIGRNPMAGNHYGLIIPQLRETQRRILRRDGIDPDAAYDLSDTALHPDQVETLRSLGRILVGVANRAPREAHNGNGAPFYAAVLPNGSEFYGQAPYFTALHAHGQIREFFEVKSDMFREGEFFRSKEVATARRDWQRWLEALDSSNSADIIPNKDDPYARFVDKFGNVLIDAPAHILRNLEPDEILNLKFNGATIQHVRVVEDLAHAKTGELSLMLDAEDDINSPRGSAFLVRKVNNPNVEADSRSAVVAIAVAIEQQTSQVFVLANLHNYDIEFETA